DPDKPEELPSTVRQVRQAEDALLAFGHPQGCVCVMQHVANASKGRGATQLCRFSGDMIAAALAGYTGEPQRSEQVSAQTAGDGDGCSFAIRPTDDEMIGRIQLRFSERLRLARRDAKLAGADLVVTG